MTTEVKAIIRSSKQQWWEATGSTALSRMSREASVNVQLSALGLKNHTSAVLCLHKGTVCLHPAPACTGREVKAAVGGYLLRFSYLRAVTSCVQGMEIRETEGKEMRMDIPSPSCHSGIIWSASEQWQCWRQTQKPFKTATFSSSSQWLSSRSAETAQPSAVTEILNDKQRIWVFVVIAKEDHAQLSRKGTGTNSSTCWRWNRPECTAVTSHVRRELPVKWRSWIVTPVTRMPNSWAEVKDAAPQTSLLSPDLIFKLDLQALAEQVSSFPHLCRLCAVVGSFSAAFIEQSPQTQEASRCCDGAEAARPGLRAVSHLELVLLRKRPAPFSGPDSAAQLISG